MRHGRSAQLPPSHTFPSPFRRHTKCSHPCNPVASRRPSSARLSRSDLHRSVLRRQPRTDSLKQIGRFAGFIPVSSIGTLGATELYLGERPSPLGTRHVLLKHLPRVRRGYLALREHMIEEGRVADRLSHPNFVAFVDADEDESGFTLAYEAPRGPDLAHVVSDLAARSDALPFELIAHIVKDLARAVSYAHHEHALVLRGLCAENIVVTRDGRIEIATHRLELGNPDREPDYDESPHLAPECAARGDYGIASDVYALGILMFTLLMGRPPAAGIDVPLEELFDEQVPERLIEVVTRSVLRNKAERYRDAVRLAAALESWLSSKKITVDDEVMASFFERHFFPR
jgi:serine/threonine protein kinase